jgi:hypothetical protein
MSDFACLSCDKKFEDHETLYETEAERKSQKKAIKAAYMPLSSNPQIQFETMKKLKLDGRSDEERMLEELSLEKEE